MNDLAKLFAAAAGGAVAMHLYRSYQTDQSQSALRAARARRAPVQRIADAATGVFNELVPASQMQGMNGHMAMPQRAHGQRYTPQSSAPQGFYAQGGMRQSAPGNPHAPVVIPSRQAPRAPAPPPPAATAEASGSNYENYGDDNVMGGQSF